MNSIYIFGATSLARLAFEYLTSDMHLNVNGFVVSKNFRKSDKFCSLPVLTEDEFLSCNSPETAKLFVAIGYKNMLTRNFVYKRYKSMGFSFLNVIASNTYIARHCAVGDNNFLMPGVVVEPGVTLGSNNVVWSNSTICHDTVVGNDNFFASNNTIGGNVAIANGIFLGFSSTILQRISVGSYAIIGANSLVKSDVESHHLYYGSPARKIKKLEEKDFYILDSELKIICN